jgi:hypothetical protein
LRILKGRRQFRYSHSRPTCRIIRNSPAKNATSPHTRRVPVLSKRERARDTKNVCAFREVHSRSKSS